MTEILYGMRIFHIYPLWSRVVEASWNAMAHVQKPDVVFRQNRRVHLNRRWRQFGRLLAAELCASAVVMLDTQCSKVVWRVLATHSICQFSLHFPSRASPYCSVKGDKIFIILTVSLSHLLRSQYSQAGSTDCVRAGKSCEYSLLYV
jgi:hypothetical protein